MKKFTLTFILISLINVTAFSISSNLPNLADEHEQTPVPAIVIQEEVEVSEDPQWTYKFLIPTSVALSLIHI